MLELVRAGGAGEHRIERIKDTPVLRLRDRLLPLRASQGSIAPRRRATAKAVSSSSSQVGNLIFGTIVDSVFHTEEIVIKPMSSKLRHIGVFSGTTILGDGSVIMILDPNGVAQSLGRVMQTARADAPERKSSEDAASEATVSLLVFRAGSQQPKAVPLSLVTRLEEIDCRRIEISDGRYLVQYRDQLMPLLCIDSEASLKREGTQPILVFSDRGRSMGLVVDEIVDIVEDRLDIEVASHRPGLLGYAVVKGATTEIVDIGHFLPQAFEDWFRGRDGAETRPKRSSPSGRRFAFFRDLLAPLIKAAGYQVVAVASARRGVARAEIRHAVRPCRDRYRDARHGRLCARRGDAGHARHRDRIRSSRSPPWFPTMPSSAAAPSASTILSPSSTAPD